MVPIAPRKRAARATSFPEKPGVKDKSRRLRPCPCHREAVILLAYEEWSVGRSLACPIVGPFSEREWQWKEQDA